MTSSVLNEILTRLKQREVAFELMRHEPAYTSQQAAAARGTPIMSGAKALVCKTHREYVLLVVPAGLQLFTRGVRKSLGIQRLRFATKDELFERTGLTPGCVPPFGSLFGLVTWCDQRFADLDRIYFSAGNHSVSVGIQFADFQRIEMPKMGSIAK